MKHFVLAVLSVGLVAAPLYTNAQQSNQVGRLGILWPAPAQAIKHYRDILLQLRERVRARLEAAGGATQIARVFSKRRGGVESFFRELEAFAKQA